MLNDGCSDGNGLNMAYSDSSVIYGKGSSQPRMFISNFAASVFNGFGVEPLWNHMDNWICVADNVEYRFAIHCL